MGPGEPAIRPSRETWIGCLIRLLASHGDQCDPSLYLFLRWLALLLFRSILSQMMPSAVSAAVLGSVLPPLMLHTVTARFDLHIYFSTKETVSHII